MKNIAEPSVFTEINLRIDKLKKDTPGQWGKMNSTQMMWHCREQLNLASGKLKIKNMFPAPIRWLLKKTFGSNVPFGKGMGTIPGIEADKREGLNFENEKTSLKNALSDFVKLSPGSTVKTHPIFGNMTHDDWGKIVYKHLDHHLRQFGV